MGAFTCPRPTARRTPKQTATFSASTGENLSILRVAGPSLPPFHGPPSEFFDACLRAAAEQLAGKQLGSRKAGSCILQQTRSCKLSALMGSLRRTVSDDFHNLSSRLAEISRLLFMGWTHLTPGVAFEWYINTIFGHLERLGLRTVYFEVDYSSEESEYMAGQELFDSLWFRSWMLYEQWVAARWPPNNKHCPLM